MQLDELKQFADDYFNEFSIDVGRINKIATETQSQIRNKQLKLLAKNK
jgi:hypothetical protein